MIEFNSVCFSYGKRRVLRDFSLQIIDGEHICLFGESGVGKTTVLRLIMGLEKASSGSINGLEGKKISAVFQEDRLLTFKTVMENLTLFGTEEKAEQVLSALGIYDAKNLFPNALSGGMARRVAIARALMIDADIYIFDEIFNGIDDDNVKKTAEFISERVVGKTVVMVSHNKRDALLLGAKEVRM